MSTRPAFEVGGDLKGPEAARAFIRSVTLTEICNLLGLPSVAVPVQVAEGLPQGVQVIAGRCHEKLCFDAAAAIEARAGGVHTNRPSTRVSMTVTPAAR